MTIEQYDLIGKQIVDAAFRIHKELGPGLLESVYEYAFYEELKIRAIAAEQQVMVELFYMGRNTGKKYFLDLLIEGKIVVEIKSAELRHPLHRAQLLSYLKLSGNKLGFLINFNVPLIKDGITRIANNLR